MNKAVVSLGSNSCDGHSIIINALEELDDMITGSSDIYEDGNGYYNAVIHVVTKLRMEELIGYFKEMERLSGRRPDSKETGVIPLDIDVVIYNDMIIRKYDYVQPYFQHGYKQL